MKKRIALFLALVLALSLTVAGCGSKKPTPKSAADILKINEEADEKSFSMDGSITMNMGMEAMGLTFDIPVTMAMNVDIVDENSHGTVDLTMDMGQLGGETKTSVEMYTEKVDDTVNVYTKSSDASSWVKEGASSQEMVNMGTSLLNGANFDSADFKHEGDTYVVTQKFSEMIAEGKMEEAFGSFFDTFASMGIDEDSVKEMIDGMGNSEVIYTFDKDCRLQSAKIENLEYSLTSDLGGTEMTVKVSMGMDFTYSNYGQLKDKDVAVPDDVKVEAN